MFSALIRTTILPLGLLGLAACGGTNDTIDQTLSENSANMLSDGAMISMACSGCHSDQTGVIASLTNYSESELIVALSRYKSEPDGTTVMHRLARGYSEHDIAAVSTYLGKSERGE